MKQRISPAAFDLIVRFETGGRAFYEGVYKSAPHWPGGSSGVTIGAGYDLGFEKALYSDWGAHISLADLTTLARCQGKTGQQGKQALSSVRHIRIPWAAAIEVFNACSVPDQIRATLRAFPGAADVLPADAFGVLVSLVFNRGESMDGERRSEMRVIRNAIQSKSAGLQKIIAAQLRSMKRLWVNDPDSDGDLVDRREQEALLVERAA